MANRNDFLQARVALANFVVSSSAATQALTSGIFIPGNAIVTGVTILDQDALGSVQTNDSATAQLYVANTQLSSSIALNSAKSIGYFGTVSVPQTWPLTSTGGVFVAVPGELVLSVQASSGTAARTWSPQIMVGYVGAAS
jgi:hypothetical protein